MLVVAGNNGCVESAIRFIRDELYDLEIEATLPSFRPVLSKSPLALGRLVSGSNLLYYSF